MILLILPIWQIQIITCSKIPVNGRGGGEYSTFVSPKSMQEANASHPRHLPLTSSFSVTLLLFLSSPASCRLPSFLLSVQTIESAR